VPPHSEVDDKSAAKTVPSSDVETGNETDESTGDKSKVSIPAASKSTGPTSAARKPAVRKPAVRKPAVRKPVASGAAAGKSAAGTTAAPQTDGATSKAATSKAAASRAAASNGAARNDAASNVAAPNTITPEAVTPNAVAPKTVKPNAVAPKSVKPKTVAPKTAAKPRPKTATKPKSKPATSAAATRVTPPPTIALKPVVIEAKGLVKRFGQTIAVSDLHLTVRAGSFYGIVGPNGAGKTTTLSMITGLLRPTAGTIAVHGIDIWARPNEAKRVMGVLPDRLRLFDRLTGAQLLYYSGTLRGLDNDAVRSRSADLAAAFGLEDALNRLVSDYSAGMTKKIALASAMIHSPRVLVLDEPFESVDPVSAANVTEILQTYVAAGGTVVLSSHGMDLIQRICDHVAIIVQGRVLAAGTIAEVRGRQSLEDRFVDLAGGHKVAEGMEWLHNFSD